MPFPPPPSFPPLTPPHSVPTTSAIFASLYSRTLMSFEDAARDTRVYHLPGPVPFHYFRGFIPGTLGAPLINHNYVSRGNTKNYTARWPYFNCPRRIDLRSNFRKLPRLFLLLLILLLLLPRVTRVCINYLN